MSAAVVSPGARTRRARSGAQAPTGRHQVGLTVPRDLKDRMLEAASVLEWSLADWVLAAAAEFGPTVPAISGLKRRQAVPDVTFCALYVTPEERAELDDQARSLDMNRSAFVTAVAQLALGASPDAVRRGLTHGEPVEIPNTSHASVSFRGQETHVSVGCGGGQGSPEGRTPSGGPQETPAEPRPDPQTLPDPRYSR
jgi:hypothetical protein